jgi:hypothetical protein
LISDSGMMGVSSSARAETASNSPNMAAELKIEMRNRRFIARKPHGPVKKKPSA